MAASTLVLAQQIQSRLHHRFEVRFTLPAPRRPERLSTGIPAVDRLTGGGIPRGTLTEIYGAGSSGRTSVLYSTLARLTANREYAALIDASNAFDPASAAEAGVVLSRLLWVRCGGNAEHALKATDLLVQASGFGLLAMDLADVPPRQAGRISLASWFRLRHAVERTPAALLVLSQELLAKSCSTLQLELRAEESQWPGEGYGKLLGGMRLQALSRKHNREDSASFEVHR